MKSFPSIQAFILGGGKSLRMKRDKALLRFEGRYFIDIVIECSASLFGSVHLVGRQYEHPLLSGCMDDEIRGVGPLGGILGALHATDAELNFIVGVDYPLIDEAVVALLAEEALTQMRNGNLGLIPVMPDGPHPVFAFYAKSCASAVIRCIRDRSLRVQCISSHVPIHYHNMTELKHGPGSAVLERNFVNINHAHDLKNITLQRDR
jgi:molybdopterin-guanine dinucleotide biosynthesis protein A